MKKAVLIFLFLLIISNLYAKPYGLRKTNKNLQFNGTAEVNYLVINKEPYTQIVLIPELTFGKIDLGIGLYLPFSIDRNGNIRKIEYNSTEALISKLYYIQYGKPETNPVFVKVSAIKDYTLGYGLILNHYTNNLSFPEVRKLGIEVAIQKSGFTFRGILGDLYTQSVFGGRFEFQISELTSSQSSFLKSFEIGATFVSDIQPKNRLLVRINNSFDHEIVRKKESSNSIFIYGADIKAILFESFIIDFGIYAEFAKINLAGEGLGYGTLGTLFPKSLGLEYKFQVRHFFNSFSPSYFNSLYDVYRSSKIDSINNQNAKMGWYVEISRMFYKKKLGLTIAYDEVFKGSFQPHFFFLFYTHGVPKKLNFTFRFDRFNFGKFSKVLKIKNLDTLFLFEILYQLTDNIETGFAYRKGFIFEANPSETLKKLDQITVYTKIVY